MLIQGGCYEDVELWFVAVFSDDFITVDEVSSGRYLTIAICDANDNKDADHGYLGDPFLNLILYTPPEPPKGTFILIQ